MFGIIRNVNNYLFSLFPFRGEIFPIEELPHEIIVHILSYLENTQTLFALYQTNSFFHSLIKELNLSIFPTKEYFINQRQNFLLSNHFIFDKNRKRGERDGERIEGIILGKGSGCLIRSVNNENFSEEPLKSGSSAIEEISQMVYRSYLFNRKSCELRLQSRYIKELFLYRKRFVIICFDSKKTLLQQYTQIEIADLIRYYLHHHTPLQNFLEKLYGEDYRGIQVVPKIILIETKSDKRREKGEEIELNDVLKFINWINDFHRKMGVTESHLFVNINDYFVTSARDVKSFDFVLSHLFNLFFK